jgi:hypothetical protein
MLFSTCKKPCFYIRCGLHTSAFHLILRADTAEGPRRILPSHWSIPGTPNSPQSLVGNSNSRNYRPMNVSKYSIMRRVEKNRTGSSRSRPVSCLFCRSRKLRCSRQFPCVNCSSRGLSCQLESSSVISTSSADESSDQITGNFQQDVLARLHRLEEIVMTQREPTQPPSDQSGSRPGPPPSRRKHDVATSFTEKSSIVDVEWLESQITHPSSAVGLCVTEYRKHKLT